MDVDTVYSRGERAWLWALGIFGFLGINGAFVYGLMFHLDAQPLPSRSCCCSSTEGGDLMAPRRMRPNIDMLRTARHAAADAEDG